MATRRLLNLPLAWLLIGAGAIIAGIFVANQADITNSLKTPAAGSSKKCQLDYNKPSVKQKIACIVKSSSNKLDAYIVTDASYKVTQKGTGASQTWEAKATCRLMCDCNNVSAQPENNGTNACSENSRNVGSNLICNVPSTYKVPFGYATTVISQEKDKFEAIKRLNEKCDAYEGAKTNACSSQCISQMPESIKNIKAEVTCRQCKTQKKPPSAPTNFSGKGISETSITWTWTDASSNEIGFKLKNQDGAVIATIPAANLTKYTEKNLKKDTSYTRSITAYNKDGESKASNTSSAKTLSKKPSATESDIANKMYNYCYAQGWRFDPRTYICWNQNGQNVLDVRQFERILLIDAVNKKKNP